MHGETVKFVRPNSFSSSKAKRPPDIPTRKWTLHSSTLTVAISNLLLPTPGHHASSTNPAGQPTNKELTKRTHTCANNVSATNPIFVNEISSLPPSHAHLHLEQTDNFPLTLYFQPEDGRIRPKHVIDILLYLQI